MNSYNCIYKALKALKLQISVDMGIKEIQQILLLGLVIHLVHSHPVPSRSRKEVVGSSTNCVVPDRYIITCSDSTEAAISQFTEIFQTFIQILSDQTVR